MNEKIEELHSKTLSQMQEMRWNISESETLVELVIQECVNVILNNDIEKREDYESNHPFFGGWERGVIDSAQIIKKHFGVEE